MAPRLILEQAVRALGVDARLAIFEGVQISNRSNRLERKKREALEIIRAIDLGGHPFLAGYRALHREVGVVEEVLPPAQHLIGLVQGGGRLPNINTAVDCYNLVSALTGLSAGAHDLAHLRGDLRLGLTHGDERYTPLGEARQVPVRPGEYACMDEEKVVCRLDVKQCQETRITQDTAAFLVYVQGCRVVPPEALLAGLRQIGELVTDICGGTCQMADELP